jgi:Helix-turn-helix domain
VCDHKHFLVLLGVKIFAAGLKVDNQYFKNYSFKMTNEMRLDPYIVDALMRDLVGHDRSPAAFLVYLWLWRKSIGSDLPSIGASLQTIAHHTGLSKSAVQDAIRRLKFRNLIEANQSAPTLAPIYSVSSPWSCN